MYIFGGAHDTVDQVVLEDNSQIWNGMTFLSFSFHKDYKRTKIKLELQQIEI